MMRRPPRSTLFPTRRSSDLNGFISGLGSKTLNRIIFDGHGGAKAGERWDVARRIRDVEEGPDGSLWMLEDANPGRSEEHTSELQSRENLVCRLLLEKKKIK